MAEAAADKSQGSVREVNKGTLILGLGSPILRDDAIGLHVVRALAERLPRDGFTAIEAGGAGLSLLPLLEGWDRVIMVDALLQPPQGDWRPCPGRLHELSLEQLASTMNLHSSHEVSVAEALTLGDWMGMAMPREVLIFGIEVEDPFTFDEEMSPALAASVERLAEQIARRCAGEYPRPVS